MLKKQFLFYTKNIILGFKDFGNVPIKQLQKPITDMQYVGHMHARIHELDRLMSKHESCALANVQDSSTASLSQAYPRKFLAVWEVQYILKKMDKPPSFGFDLESKNCMILDIPKDKFRNHGKNSPIILLRKGNFLHS